MLIDLKTKKEKLRMQAVMERAMTGLEVIGRQRIANVLNKQYIKSARFVDQGIMNIDYAVNSEALLMVETFVAYYNKIARVFGDMFFDSLKVIERKDAESDFKRIIQNWGTTQAAQKVTLLQKTTKKTLGFLIGQALSEGLSNRDTALSILKQGKITNGVRASLIARNEAHTGAVNAVQKAAETSRVEMKREWVTKIDDRTHGADVKDEFNHVIANGERVDMKEVFTMTGEALMYPGDPKGSPGNTINCRCVIAYHRINQVDRR